MTTSQDSSTSQTSGTQRQLHLSTAERIMILDNRSKSNLQPNSVNAMADLLQQFKGSKSKNLKLSLENQALKQVQRRLKSKLKKKDSMLIMKEDVGRERDKVIATLQSEKVALVNKNDELMAKLKTAQNQNRDCKTACNLRVDYLEGLIWKGQSENSICFKRTKELESLVEAKEKKWLNMQENLQNNVELTEKLRAMQTQIHQLESDTVLKVNTLEDQLRSEQVEKETCLQKIKELNSPVETTEKKWLNVQEDLQKNVELRAKMCTAQTLIDDCKAACNLNTDYIKGLVLRVSVCSERVKELESLVETSDLKVNTLEAQLRSEQVEKETCLQRTKELESLVETTVKPPNVQKMEEDIKFLIVKSIKLQELALMSDSDKAKRREEERKVQKKQEKIEKDKREMELKDKKHQEKKKQQKIAKELIEKLRVRR
ncbi:golgin subfamily A member 6-like protein 25 [Platichthys flesus]|uniref:golgin subfamily A member 6-like protein 25 n=1 Tax=Platichthys flesus TaxID=8260 RepID=UPI002DBFFB0F|nr:golgin subfamily A member 6-like protein 25 [Platichthys flesus]